jgi:hypothetical protein
VAEGSKLSFEECARLSGLLSPEQLEQIIEAAKERWNDLPEDPVLRGERLAEQAVAMGLLNPWQARQLLEGRTKFTLGSYRVVDSLGRGGVGQVFKAVHELLGREVAIKVLPRERATAERVEQFLREIRLLASLDHPHLVQALDAGKDGGVYYLVLEYVPGLDLRKYVQISGPLTPEEAATIIAQVALGLDYAHRRGLVHRDVKPGNVLVTSEGRAKLSDLGFASSVFGEELTEARKIKIMGTADYLAPDQIQAPWDPRPTWDIYSLGCTLYYAVTGRVPFPEGTTEEKIRAHLEKDPPDPREFNPRLPDDFVTVVRQMMAKDPGARPATAHEVVLRLGPWVDPAVLPGEYALFIGLERQARLSFRQDRTSHQGVAADREAGKGAPLPGATLAERGEIAGAPELPGGSREEAASVATSPVAKTPGAAPVPTLRRSPSSVEFSQPEESADEALAPFFALLLFVVLPLVLISLALVLASLGR